MRTHRALRQLVLAPTLLLAILLAGSARSAQELAPTRDEARTMQQTVRALRSQHYAPVALDDAFSAHALERYLTLLDPRHEVFLRSDVRGFEDAYGSELDEAVAHNDLRPAFEIFERYRTRRLQQLDFLEARVAEEGALEPASQDETLEVDRADAPWPATEEAARALWEAELRGDALELTLAERTPEQVVEALGRRFAGQRRQLEQITSDDVFALFLNVVGGEFDPHTSYFPPVGAENFEMSMKLSFEGIGALLGTDGEYARVESLIPGGPAERSGRVHPTDRILAVGQGLDGELVDVVGWRLDEIVKLIRGPRGSVVRLELAPEGVPLAGAAVVTLERDQVQLEDQAASSEVLELEQDGQPYRIGVITLPTFYLDLQGQREGATDARSASRDVARLLVELEQDGVEGVVLDLRDNGGGALSEAQAVAGLFLGPEPVVQVRDARGRVGVLEAPNRAVYGGPLVVLVNRLSASASEIVAAAIQDYGRGVVVGSRTFGKGTVQGILPLSSGEVKLTQAKFYRVSGGSTQLLGVEPDVALPSSYDPNVIGESALPQALPHDRVEALRLRAPSQVERLLPALRELHAARAATDPELVALTARLDLVRAQRERTTLSLDEATRRAEQQALEQDLLQIENTRRVALGLEPLEGLDVEETAHPDPSDPVRDPWAVEAARIAHDLARAGGKPELVERGEQGRSF